MLAEGCPAIPEVCRCGRCENRAQRAAGPHTARSAPAHRVTVTMMLQGSISHEHERTNKVYLVRYLKVLASPYLQSRVVQSQLKEKVSLYSKETSCHGRRPAGTKTQSSARNNLRCNHVTTWSGVIMNTDRDMSERQEDGWKCEDRKRSDGAPVRAQFTPEAHPQTPQSPTACRSGLSPP